MPHAVQRLVAIAYPVACVKRLALYALFCASWHNCRAAALAPQANFFEQHRLACGPLVWILGWMGQTRHIFLDGDDVEVERLAEECLVHAPSPLAEPVP